MIFATNNAHKLREMRAILDTTPVPFLTKTRYIKR